MTFEQALMEDRRLTILQGLAAATQWSVNVHLLQSFCDAVGHRVSRDRIAHDVSWLAEQSLLHINDNDGVMVATLTEHGGDVVDGRTVVPGVKRPRPGV
jgi:hypothetical protein